MSFIVSNNIISKNHYGAGIIPASFFYFLIGFIPLLTSCSSEEETESGEVIATVYNKHLYLDEITEMIPIGMMPEDSLEFVKNYIQQWTNENILLHQAEKELGENTKSIQRRIDKYRRSLMIYEFEQSYIQKNLDTIISDEEIEKHYNDNQDDFELKDYIIKAVYIKFDVSISAKDKGNVLKWLRGAKKEDLIKLEEYCGPNALSFYHDRDNWIFLNDILRDMPMEIANKEAFLRTNKMVEFSDDEYYYVLQILDSRMKEEVSPLSLEKENIKARILQSRMNDLLKSMRNKMILKAYDENEVKLSNEK